jgi:polyhydroxyalkanoate synthesis repressor PhaR
MRLIKRYSNRRLYDTETSRTLTHAELADLIRDGVEVKVVDSATGKDITVAVLGRIVLAEAPTWGDMKKSKELFTKIIAIGGSKSMSILKNTVLASIGAFHVTKEKAEKIIDDLIKKGELDESQRKKAVMELLEKAEKSTAGFREKVSKEVGKAQQEISRIAKELKEYKLVKRGDLEKLEEKIDKLSQAVAKLEKHLAEK